MRARTQAALKARKAELESAVAAADDLAADAQAALDDAYAMVSSTPGVSLEDAAAAVDAAEADSAEAAKNRAELVLVLDKLPGAPSPAHTPNHGVPAQAQARP